MPLGSNKLPSKSRVEAAGKRKMTPTDVVANMAQGHRMLQAVELPRSATSPRKVGDSSLATFRTSAIFENDRVQAEVLAQC